MKLYLLNLLAAANSYASALQTFACDMKDLVINHVVTGPYQLQVSEDSALLQAGGFAFNDVATLSRIASKGQSSTIFIHKDEKGRIEHSFDILSSGDTGVLIWRGYGWEDPNATTPVNISVHICKKR